MEECAHRTWMHSPPAKVNRGINSRKEKVEMSEIKLGLSFMVDDFVNKFQIICLKGTYIVEQTPNTEHVYRQMEGQTWVQCNAPDAKGWGKKNICLIYNNINSSKI